MPAGIEIDHGALADFCRANHIRKLSLFGSVLRDDFGPESDVDVLVEFEPGLQSGTGGAGRKLPGHVPGYGFIRIQRELSTLFGGRKVDLLTPKSVNRRIRDSALAEAEVQYVAG